MFTDDSVLELTNLASSAELRFSEVFGDADDAATGMQGLGSAQVSQNTSNVPAELERDGSRVTSIRLTLRGQQDIDAIRGHARLTIGPAGYLRGYETDFDVKAGFFDS